MSASYNIPASESQFEFEIKRSQFISYAAQASDRQAADAFIRSIRKIHPQARHVCWAYIAGAPTTTEMSMSDDGEPSGTAGRPMLNILQHSGIGEIVVAVVRYYGGIKLGTGGLQRAYSDAVSGVLTTLSLRTKIPRLTVTLTYDYSQESTVRYLLGRYNVEDEQINYDLQVSLTAKLVAFQVDAFKTELNNLSSGAIEFKTAPEPEN